MNPSEDELPETNSMLDDLYATDEPDPADLGPSIPYESEFQVIDQNNLTPTDWSVLIASLMGFNGWTKFACTEAERDLRCKASDPSNVRVLIMKMHPRTFELRLELVDGEPSEFRS